MLFIDNVSVVTFGLVMCSYEPNSKTVVCSSRDYSTHFFGVEWIEDRTGVM